jgi:hypothetical protein
VPWNQQQVASHLPQDQDLGLVQGNHHRVSSNLSLVQEAQVFRMELWTNSNNSHSSLILSASSSNNSSM